MASIGKRVRNDRVTWVARWREPSGRQRKRSFRRKADAERFLTGVQHAQLAGTYIDPALARVTVADWSDRWLAQLQVKPSTAARYESLLRVHVLPTWGRVPLHAVTHAEVARWVAELTGKGLASATVRQAHRVFSLLLALAVRDNRIPRNPASGVRLPRGAPKEKRWLTHVEVAALADAAGDCGGLVIRVLAYTGLRFGELAALRVSRVDMTRRRITVAESVTEVAGKAVFGTPKTHATRSVSLPQFLLDRLADQVADKPDDAFVFPAPQGGVLRLRNWRRHVFDPAVTAAGLNDLSPHDLRHTAASLAIAAGANVKAVQRMLGHASAAMTLDVYSGLFEDDIDQVAERLNTEAQAQPSGRPALGSDSGSMARLQVQGPHH